MSTRCNHEDGKHRCHCPSHQRTGDLAKVVGRSPACVLVGAAPSVRCLDQVKSKDPILTQEEIAQQMSQAATEVDAFFDLDDFEPE